MLRTVPAAIGIVGLVLVAAGMFARGNAQSAQLLANGTFDSWSSPEPDGWSVSGTAASTAWPGGGSAASLTGDSSLTQVVSAVPGRMYSASVSFLGTGGIATGKLRLYFLDAGFLDVGLPVLESRAASTEIQVLAASAVAPPSAAWVGVRLISEPDAPDGSVLFAQASLVEQADAEATATPTFTPTPEDPPTPTRTSTPRSPAGGMPGLPTPGDGGDSFLVPPPGELLLNRGFDTGEEGEPVAWENFGGTLLWSANGGKHGGAGTLISLTTSTKWAYQVVPVAGGESYEASVLAMVGAGTAETWISVLWYPTVDGSGESMASDESESLSPNTWAVLSLGPIPAPVAAKSARFRLMVRAAFPAAVSFDDATFHVAASAADEGAGEPLAGVTPGAPRRDETPANRAPAATESRIPAGDEPQRMATPRPPRTGNQATPSRTCDVCLSEVMSDPANAGRDAPFEWVEVQNTSGDAVDLDGWSVGDAKSTDRIEGPLQLQAGGYLVIAARSADVGAAAAVFRVADGEIGDGLNNDGDTVRLLRPDGAAADILEYGPASALAPATDGRSLAFDEASADWWNSQASPGGPALPVPAVALPPTTFGPEPQPSYVPWIVLGVCVAIGVFSAPFAIQRLRTGASHASIPSWLPSASRRSSRTSDTRPAAKRRP